MTILTINGETDAPSPTALTLAAAGRRPNAHRQGVAAAVDGAVAPAVDCGRRPCCATGDAVEILTAVQGG